MKDLSFTTLNEALMCTSHPLLQAVRQSYRIDETQFVDNLVKRLDFTPAMQQNINSYATQLVKTVREKRLSEGGIDAFLLQYDLSSEEGIALMCLAEALLRIPDKKTVDKLIKDKLTQGDWGQHAGKSHSLFVNAATWGLMLTGKVLGQHRSLKNLFKRQEASLSSGLQRIASKGGEPVVRQAVHQAMRILSKQFVMGRDVKEALKRAKSEEKKGYRYSYDMLGEAAFTKADAEKYLRAYYDAIENISKNGIGKGPVDGPGISVKLSALHPRFETAKRERLHEELIPTVKELAMAAKHHNIGFTIDAEEADQLFVLLEVVEAIIQDPAFSGWEGFGLAIQAYQKRAKDVIKWVADTARQYNKKIMVRLVKGAYWDTEIKLAQVNGLSGYPVFTRKVATDVNYLACAQDILKLSDVIYPQFATHNAHTVAAVRYMAEGAGVTAYEFQCLHGMGSTLYEDIVSDKVAPIPCRIYAPVGAHEDLLAYLVRRLLENGANTSFVNRIADEKLPISEMVADPIAKLKDTNPKPHPQIPLPKDLYGDARVNSKGIDFKNPNELAEVYTNLEKVKFKEYHASPTQMGGLEPLETKAVFSPIDRDIKLGKVTLASKAIVENALTKAQGILPTWRFSPCETRVNILNTFADELEINQAELLHLLMLEGGKILEDAIAELREAVDFCRYYAAEASKKFGKPKDLPGPTGEQNQLSLHGRGIMACISPWNFPLAIFVGQVTAAFAAGNCVIAKPASQTPLVAAKAIELFHYAGAPLEVVQLLPGSGSVVGNMLVEDSRISGVMFTGSTETARHINQQLAARPGPIVPFIAETGGQNAMIVDSTALPEQVVTDVIASSFKSAGQRCSSLRVLYLQDDVADKILTMLKGAMDELTIGNPMALANDIGPVIDESAKNTLQSHIDWVSSIDNTKVLYESKLGPHCSKGSFFAPRIIELSAISQLKEEVFGPVLHVVRYKQKDLDSVLQDINQTGFGLTLGIHSRIDETIAYIYERCQVGNIYVNRNMIGAVVGVQPFGGEGLSGTGPKAGGPNYLMRLATERTLSINTTAAGGNATLMSLSENNH